VTNALQVCPSSEDESLYSSQGLVFNGARPMPGRCRGAGYQRIRCPNTCRLPRQFVCHLTRDMGPSHAVIQTGSCALGDQAVHQLRSGCDSPTVCEPRSSRHRTRPVTAHHMVFRLYCKPELPATATQFSRFTLRSAG
jgi:hypothetical protein